jgi:hypothetical protein
MVAGGRSVTTRSFELYFDPTGLTDDRGLRIEGRHDSCLADRQYSRKLEAAASFRS